MKGGRNGKVKVTEMNNKHRLRILPYEDEKMLEYKLIFNQPRVNNKQTTVTTEVAKVLKSNTC